jgi:hypothetical protein
MPSQKSRQRKSRSHKRSRQHKRGGSGGATAWGQAAFGGPDAQTAVPNTNLLNVNNLQGVNMCNGGVAANAASFMSGGNPMRTHIKGGQLKSHLGGKSVLMDVAVPAVLLYANQMAKPRKTMGHKYKKHYSRKNYSRKYRR